MIIAASFSGGGGDFRVNIIVVDVDRTTTADANSIASARADDRILNRDVIGTVDGYAIPSGVCNRETADHGTVLAADRNWSGSR